MTDPVVEIINGNKQHVRPIGSLRTRSDSQRLQTGNQQNNKSPEASPQHEKLLNLQSAICNLPSTHSSVTQPSLAVFTFLMYL
jgi:hypothetical protein